MLVGIVVLIGRSFMEQIDNMEKIELAQKELCEYLISMMLFLKSFSILNMSILKASIRTKNEYQLQAV